MTRLPDAVFLDLDDTILDDSGSVVASWRDACAEAARRNPSLDPERLYEVNREYADWWWSDPSRHREGRLNLRQSSREILTEALRRCGCDDADLAADISNFYRDLREERTGPFPGALDLLAELRNSGVRLGMMTNGAAVAQRAKIERFGLAEHFDHIVIEGELGVGKPDRLVFETLLTKLGVSASGTWAVGDNLEFDVLAPMELGIHGVWLDRDGAGCGGPRQPDRIIAALVHLLD